MKDLNELHRKRGNLIAQMRGVLDKANSEKRDLDGEEQAKYDAMDADQEKLLAAIEREQRQAELERAQNATDKPAPRPTPDSQEQRANPLASEEYRKGFNDYLLNGGKARSAETRALQADASVAGGFIVAPEQFYNFLIKAVDNYVFLRQLATVIPVQNAMSLGVPSLDVFPDDADWTAEIKTGSEDTAMAFGKRELHPHPCAKRIKISNRLLRVSALSVDSLVRDRLAYKFGITQEKAFLTGSGAQQPLGVFTASPNGINTDRDITAGTTTAITADGLISSKYALKAQYQKTARWLFHRDALKTIRQLKDGMGQYLWSPGLKGDRPDTILELPYMMSEYAPNTFTTGLYVGVLGDFSFYWIADALSMSVQVVDQLYAENNQTGYIGRMETDGQPVLSEAFVRLKLA